MMESKRNNKVGWKMANTNSVFIISSGIWKSFYPRAPKGFSYRPVFDSSNRLPIKFILKKSSKAELKWAEEVRKLLEKIKEDLL